MKLAIIVPVLNEGAELASRLRALQPLRQRGAQLIVVDGGSQDSTWAIASSQADKVLLAPRGRASQMNAGAAHSNSDVLLFLHADTELPPHADELIAAALNDSKVHWGRFDVRIDSALPTLRWVETLMNLRSRLTSIATGDQAMFYQAIHGLNVLGICSDELMPYASTADAAPVKVGVTVTEVCS